MNQTTGLRSRINTDRKSIGGIPQSMTLAKDMNNGHFEDKYLYEMLVRYGRILGAGENREKGEPIEPNIVIDIRINCPV